MDKCPQKGNLTTQAFLELLEFQESCNLIVQDQGWANLIRPKQND